MLSAPHSTAVDRLHDIEADAILSRSCLNNNVSPTSNSGQRCCSSWFNTVSQHVKQPIRLDANRGTAPVSSPKFLTAWRQWQYIEVRYNKEFLCKDLHGQHVRMARYRGFDLYRQKCAKAVAWGLKSLVSTSFKKCDVNSVQSNGPHLVHKYH